MNRVRLGVLQSIVERTVDDGPYLGLSRGRYARQMTHFDRVLSPIGVRNTPSHVVAARRLLLEPKERRESGEDKREFEELLGQDWLEFDRRFRKRK